MTSKSRNFSVKSARTAGHGERFSTPNSGVRGLKRFIDGDHHNIEGRPFAETVKKNVVQAKNHKGNTRFDSLTRLMCGPTVRNYGYRSTLSTQVF